MPRYRVSKPFKKRLSKKSPGMQGAIVWCIQRLSENPLHPGLQAHQMQGRPGVWEAYVDQGNRLTFHYEEADGEQVIVLRNHCNHDMLYQNP